MKSGDRDGLFWISAKGFYHENRRDSYLLLSQRPEASCSKMFKWESAPGSAWSDC